MKTLFIGVFVLALGTKLPIIAQDSHISILEPFEFTIQVQESELILTGVKGTAWKELSFTLVAGDHQLIDAEGMVSHEEIVAYTSDEVQGFLVLVSHENGAVKMEGFHGTAWKELSILNSLSKTYVVDQNGGRDRP